MVVFSVHTAELIVGKCLAGDLMKGRTTILVTHNIPVTKQIAEFVVSLKNGRITSQGTLSDVLAEDVSLAIDFKNTQETLEDVESKVDAEPPTIVGKEDGKLILSEELEVGGIAWPASA